MYLKILIKILTLFLMIYNSVAYAQQDFRALDEADSLFYKKQYTQALERYEEIFKNGKYSPRMLVKMSLIKEGLGDYTYALYYLGIYYSIIPDQEVLKKMDDIAIRYNLKGYEYNDFEFFLSLYNEYQFYIFLALLLTVLVLLVYLYFRNSRTVVRVFFTISSILLLLVVILFVNFKVFPEEAIVTNNASIMSAPSSGSDIVGVIEKGNKVRIIKENDIWYQIIWDNDFAYIRQHQVLPFKLDTEEKKRGFIFNLF